MAYECTMHEGSANADYLFTDLDSGSVLAVCGEHFLTALVGIIMAQCEANGTTPAEVFGWLDEPPTEPETATAEPTPKSRRTKPTQEGADGSAQSLADRPTETASTQ